MASRRQRRRTRRSYTPKTSAKRSLRFSPRPIETRYQRVYTKPSVRRGRTLTVRPGAKTRRSTKPQPKHLAIKKLTLHQEPVKIHCRKRAQRKQIMHATNRAGQSGQKSPIWTKESRLRC